MLLREYWQIVLIVYFPKSEKNQRVDWGWNDHCPTTLMRMDAASVNIAKNRLEGMLSPKVRVTRWPCADLPNKRQKCRVITQGSAHSLRNMRAGPFLSARRQAPVVRRGQWDVGQGQEETRNPHPEAWGQSRPRTDTGRWAGRAEVNTCAQGRLQPCYIWDTQCFCSDRCSAPAQAEAMLPLRQMQCSCSDRCWQLRITALSAHRSGSCRCGWVPEGCKRKIKWSEHDFLHSQACFLWLKHEVICACVCVKSTYTNPQCTSFIFTFIFSLSHIVSNSKDRMKRN